jgi:L-aminopeptidase/D-esterase-like protein
MDNSITDVPGILVGHAENREAATGCTVVLCEQGAVTGVDVRGGAPGTREISALDPVNYVREAHAVYLGGGSAFGLDGAAGVMQYLEERGIGLDVGIGKVPIVPGAVLFDLPVVRPDIRPDKAMGYEACANACSPNTRQGNVGAGTGATVGKTAGMQSVMKGGVGTASFRAGGLIVGALVAVNCFGDVIDPDTGKIIAGVLTPDKKDFADSLRIITAVHEEESRVFKGGNTTIGVIATNAKLTKPQATKIAMMGHDGYARTINPIHTMYDGDSIFCMAAGEVETDLTTLGAVAAFVVAKAVVNGVKSAESAYGIPGFYTVAGSSASERMAE